MESSYLSVLVLFLMRIKKTSGEITVDSITPKSGFYYGGANLTVVLDLGNNLKGVEIDEVSAFVMDFNNETTPFPKVETRQEENKLHIHLVTPDIKSQTYETTGKIFLAVLKNGSERGKIHGIFHFKPNPNVEKKFDPLATIISGGIMVTVKGDNFDGSITTYMRAVGKGADERPWSNQDPCEVVSTIEVRCRTPRLSVTEEKVKDIMSTVKDHSEPFNLSYLNKGVQFYLITDGLAHPLDLPRVYLDPILEVFDDDRVFVVNRGSKRISIEGVWPKAFPSFMENTHIQVGGKDCLNVKRDNHSHVSCTPPSLPSHVIRFGLADVTTLPVKVRVGNFEQTLGNLKYAEDDEFFGSITTSMIIILSVIIITSVGFAVHTECSSRKTKRFRTGSTQMEIIRTEDPDSSKAAITSTAYNNRNNNNNNLRTNDDDEDDNDNDDGDGGGGGGQDEPIRGRREKNGTNEKGDSFELESLLSPGEGSKGGR